MAVRTELQHGVGHLVLDRPERAHAYDRAHLDALIKGARELASQAPVLLVRSTGTRAFCAGADTDALRDSTPLDALELRSNRVFTALAELQCVTIAVVHGPAVAGGFELALACDLRVAGPAARFWLPETQLGIVPSAGGTTRLTRLVGPARAKEVILAGRVLSADDALAWGVVNRVATDPLADATAWAAEIARRTPEALRSAKELIDADLDTRALARERYAEAVLYANRPR